MSTLPGFQIQLQGGESLRAEVGSNSYGGQWLWLRIDPGNAGSMSLFIPGEDRAKRLADAINAAWPQPEAVADPPRYVPGSQGPHPRPGYHVQAGRHGPGGSPPVTRGHDRLLPCTSLDALNGAGPDRAGWADAFNTHEADGNEPEAA